MRKEGVGVKIAVLVSGGGTNLQALLDAEARGEIKSGEISAVISSSAEAFALERARHSFVPSYVLCPKDYADAEDYGAALDALLTQLRVQLVVLAGFMTVLPSSFCRKWDGRVMNVHPSLIPSFSGAGYYGLRVHAAALEKGVKITGATVHFVSEVVDGGAIILQKAVEVLQDDTPQTLQQRVMTEAEWQILPRAVSLFCEGRLHITGDLVRISP